MSMHGKLLSPGSVMSDDILARQVKKVSSLSAKSSFGWLSFSVLLQALLAGALCAAVFVFYHTIETVPPSAGIEIHRISGFVLGVLLVTRIALSTVAVFEAVKKVQAFSKACRTLAVLSSYVNETLTISAGAELEKKAVRKFRYELVRLLNMAVYSYHLMLKGLKLTVLPPSLRAEGAKMESEVTLPHIPL